MINLDRLNRIRTVQDMDGRGTVVSEDTLHNDSETVFPLQVALGSQMARTLFLAPHCLLVNAPSDLIYLQVLGEMAASKGLARLDPRWVVIPVGGADNLPTFVSLLGESYVSVAVLMDITPTNKEKLDRFGGNGGGSRTPIRWVEVTRIRDADIEDLFEPNFYLNSSAQTYDGELPAPLTLKSISGSNPRIVKRISDYFHKEGISGGAFDPYRPAANLLQKHSEIRHRIDDTTIEEAASLFPAHQLALADQRGLVDREPEVHRQGARSDSHKLGETAVKAHPGRRPTRRDASLSFFASDYPTSHPKRLCRRLIVAPLAPSLVHSGREPESRGRDVEFPPRIGVRGRLCAERRRGALQAVSYQMTIVEPGPRPPRFRPPPE